MKVPMVLRLTIAAAIVFSWTALTGCVAPTINLQLSSLRSAGDVATTIYLDERELAGVPKRQEEIKKFAEKIAEFLDSGNAAKLTETKLRDGVLKLVPEVYQGIGASLLDSLSKRDLNVDTQAIGESNISRLKAFLHGAIVAVDDYKIDLRKKEEEEAAAKAAAEAAAEAAEPPAPAPSPAEPSPAVPVTAPVG